MSQPRLPATVIGLDAGVRETGWAAFSRGEVRATGSIALRSRHRIDASDRVAHLIECLDRLVADWEPEAIACCQPTGIGWKMLALELLDAALADWSARHRLCLYSYTAQEVRAAVAGHPNASRGDLSLAVMARFGLIGHCKTTHEWEAIAIGEYHLNRWSQA